MLRYFFFVYGASIVRILKFPPRFAHVCICTQWQVRTRPSWWAVTGLVTSHGIAEALCSSCGTWVEFCMIFPLISFKCQAGCHRLKNHWRHPRPKQLKGQEPTAVDNNNTLLALAIIRNSNDEDFRISNWYLVPHHQRYQHHHSPHHPHHHFYPNDEQLSSPLIGLSGYQNPISCSPPPLPPL